MAIRHDIRVRMFLNGQWRDVTDRVRQTSPIAIDHGRGDEQAETPPSTCDLLLDNTSDEWSVRNPMGPWFGTLGQNNPIEVLRRSVLDTFGRTLPSTWGAADTGQAWTLAGTVTSVSAVGAGVGTVQVQAATNTSTNYLAGVLSADVDVTGEATLPVTNITGGAVYPCNLIARGISPTNYVYARVEILTDETVTVGIRNADGTVYRSQVVVPGLVHTSAAGLSVRLQVEGGTARVKVWHTTDGEPLGWHASRIAVIPRVAGFVGIRSELGTGNSNGPLTFGYPSFAAGSPRFSGEISDLQTDTNEADTDRTAPVAAAGITRRLNQHDPVVMPSFRRGLRGIGEQLRAYWPAEDLDGSTSIASGIGGPPMGVSGGAVDFAASTAFVPASAALPKVKLSGWFGDVPDYVDVNGSAQLRFLVDIPAAGTTNDSLLAVIGDRGTASRWEVVYFTGSGGQLAVKAYDLTGALILTGGPAAFSVDGNPTRLSLELDNVGADVNWALSAFRLDGGAGGISGTLAGKNIGVVEHVQIAPQGVIDDVAFGHITVESAITDLYANTTELRAWAGERALSRMIRICAENGIPFSWREYNANDTVPMGKQKPLGAMAILRECALADGGTLYDARGTMELVYRTRKGTYAQTPAVTLDVAGKQLMTPFRPVEDDRNRVNDITVTRTDGSSARATLDGGRMSTQEPPNGVGRYEDPVTVNVQNDTDLPDQAGWRLALGTVDEPRYPNVNVVFDAPETQAIVAASLDVTVDDRIQVVNASAVGIFDDINQVARGTKETWTNHLGRFWVNASPYAPYDVAILDDTGIRLDSGSSSLTAGINSTVGTMSVTTTDPFDLWTTAGSFPFPITVGGEEMSVTNITGATSPQTFTVTRSQNAVVKSHLAGAEVHVLRPFRLAL